MSPNVTVAHVCVHATTNYIDICINSHHICNINYIVLFENGVNVWNNITKKKNQGSTVLENSMLSSN